MSKYIRLNKDVVKTMFERCNKAYFNNGCDTPRYFYSRSLPKGMLGLTRCEGWNSRINGYNASLSINRRYRWSEYSLEQVVVHEMIHLYIKDYCRPLKWFQRLPLIGRLLLNQHDKEFIAVMHDLNANYGLAIDIRFPAMANEFMK